MAHTILQFTPKFELTANDQNITATILDRFVSLRLTDETGNTSDTLEITLADHDPKKPIAIPPTGAMLKLYLGYANDLAFMGMFSVDEVELDGPPGMMHIRARGATFDQGNQGQFHLQTQKVRTWKIGTKIGDMVAKMAKEHGMTAVVSKSLASIGLPNVDQSDESDLNVLLRVVARGYDAIVKPVGDKLVVAKRGEFKSISGEQLPRVTLVASECGKWRMTQQKRDSAGTIVARYHNTKKAKLHIVSVGSGNPVLRIKKYFQNEAEARAAATAELTRRTRAMVRMAIDGPGRNDLVAEAEVRLQGWRDGIPTIWLVNRVEHELDRQGYKTTIELEQPNPDQVYEVVDNEAAPQFEPDPPTGDGMEDVDVGAESLL
jgi:phage protein D